MRSIILQAAQACFQLIAKFTQKTADSAFGTLYRFSNFWNRLALQSQFQHLLLQRVEVPNEKIDFIRQRNRFRFRRLARKQRRLVLSRGL